METRREDVGIAIRSAFLSRGTKQRFSIFVLIALSIVLIFIETLENKPINFIRSFVKDVIYRSSSVVASPVNAVKSSYRGVINHINLYDNYNELKIENIKLKENFLKSNFLKLENIQLKKIIGDKMESDYNIISARVMLEADSPYLNSLIINIGSNKKIQKGMAVLDGNNFIGRIVDVNFFSSRVLLISDLNSKIPVIVEPQGYHAIIAGHGKIKPTLEYLPENHAVKNKDKIYTSGKEGIFLPGLPIGEIKVEKNIVTADLLSDLNQITYVNIMIDKLNN